MKKLGKEQILLLHTQIVEQTGGSNGVRDYNLLESALETPFQTFLDTDLYPTVQAKAAGKADYENLLEWVLSHQN